MSKDPASFRDPSGFVFQHENRIFRALDPSAAELFGNLQKKPQFARLQRDRLIVGTRLVDDTRLLKELQAQHPDFPAFLEHDRIAPITYPYEWTPSMLADAGDLTLRLQAELLTIGLSLKDATAYNIQFIKGIPIFIDLTSIEVPARLDVWFALGQFNRMFLYPLLLVKQAGWDLRSYFLANLDGRSTLQVGQAFAAHQRWKPSLLLDVGIPFLLERLAQKRATKRSAFKAGLDPAGKPQGNPVAQSLTLRRLAGKLTRVADSIAPQTIWSDYTSICSYDGEAEASKKAIVRDFLLRHKPSSVIDIGCNTGDYSRIAAECGAQVLASDFDPGAVETLYRRLRQEPATITPMVVDVANPSPGIGYMNTERLPFLQRAQADCVLALALIHHLLVGANLPMPAIRDLLCQLTRQHLVLEFVPTNDEMFTRLIEFRVDLYQDITLDGCKSVFSERFSLLDEAPIKNSPRTLLFFEKRRLT